MHHLRPSRPYNLCTSSPKRTMSPRTIFSSSLLRECSPSARPRKLTSGQSERLPHYSKSATAIASGTSFGGTAQLDPTRTRNQSRPRSVSSAGTAPSGLKLCSSCAPDELWEVRLNSAFHPFSRISAPRQLTSRFRSLGAGPVRRGSVGLWSVQEECVRCGGGHTRQRFVRGGRLARGKRLGLALAAMRAGKAGQGH